MLEENHHFFKKIKAQLSLIRVLFISIIVLGILVLSLPEKSTKNQKANEELSQYKIPNPNIVDGIDLASGLIVDTHFELVKTTCGACHTTHLVTQNKATRQGWKELIVWMQQSQKLWDLGDEEEKILDYLAKNYAPKNSGRRKNLKIAEWYELK